MSAALSSARVGLLRYARSPGLWLMLLIAPIGARFMIAPRGSDRGLISVGGHLPWLTSPVLGMELGVVIATLLLPVAFIYLRANVNRRQPWQVEEPSPASRIAIAYGRFAADAAVLGAILAATTAAGLLLAVFLLPLAEVDPFAIILTLWAITAPPLAMVAALRILFDARPFTRGPMGEVLCFVFWMGSLTFAIAARHGHGFAAAMTDIDGFMSPLAYVRGDDNFAIGGGEIIKSAQPIALDVMGGVLAPGYLPARLAWLAIAGGLIPLLAGLIYAPHVAGKARRTPAWLARLLSPGPAPAADPAAPPARRAALPALGLVAAELRLLTASRPLALLMVALTLAAWFLPYGHVAGPAAMLLLVFATTAYAGAAEARGLLALTRTAPYSPWARRLAFVAAGTILALAMGGPAIDRALMAGDLAPLLNATLMGALTSAAAITLSAATGSPAAARLPLLIAWYLYFNWGGG